MSAPSNSDKIDRLIGALVVYQCAGNGMRPLYLYRAIEAWVEAFGDDDLAGLQQRCAEEMAAQGYDVKRHG